MRKILIIEDDPYVRALYQRYFDHHQQDYQFIYAGSGEEGLTKAKEELPMLILLDIMMPGMKGVDVLRELKAYPQTKDTMVIMLTNWGDTEHIQEAMRLGATGFMMKSEFTPDQLHGQIRSYIQKYLEGHKEETGQ